MTIQIKQSSTTYPLVFLMVDSTDHITGKTGLSPTVTLSKAGGTFASPSGAVTEIANGWYKVAGNATDSNTLGPLILHATGTGADPTDRVYNVTARLMDDLAYPATTGRSLLVDAAGGVAITTVLKKNQALAKYQFLMTDSTAHNPATGKTVTVTRSIDGAAYAATTAGTATEVANGTYYIDLSAADLNGNVVVLRCTATGCDDLFITFTMEP